MSIPFSLPPDAAARMAMLANIRTQSEYTTPPQNDPTPTTFAQGVEEENDE